MRTELAFALGELYRGNEQMVFDWNRAAEIIRKSGCKEARAGLESDWEWTGDYIFKDGKPFFEGSTYLASTWARPQLEIDGELTDCYKIKNETPGWHSDTKWPESALKICLVCKRQSDVLLHWIFADRDLSGAGVAKPILWRSAGKRVLLRDHDLGYLRLEQKHG